MYIYYLFPFQLSGINKNKITEGQSGRYFNSFAHRINLN